MEPGGPRQVLERAAKPTPNAPRIAQASLVLGLLGIALGVFVAASAELDSLAPFSKAEVVPYVLGALGMLGAIVSLVVEKRYKLGAAAFVCGAGAILIGVILLYVLFALVVAIVVGAVASQ